MKLVVMRVALEVVDYLLPVCGEDVFVRAMKSLVDLDRNQFYFFGEVWMGENTFAHAPV